MIDTLKRAVVPALLLVAAYYAVFGGEYSVFEIRSARASVEVERANLQTLHAEIEALQAAADSLRSDPATIERVAREEFGMIREGETLYRFADGDPDGEEERAPTR